MYLDNFIIKISKSESESDYYFIASNSSSQLIEARPNYCDGGGLRDIFRRFQQRLPGSNYSVDPSRPFILWLFIILLLYGFCHLTQRVPATCPGSHWLAAPAATLALNQSEARLGEYISQLKLNNLLLLQTLHKLEI